VKSPCSAPPLWCEAAAPGGCWGDNQSTFGLVTGSVSVSVSVSGCWLLVHCKPIKELWRLLFMQQGYMPAQAYE
jgi:hypothetical protein